MKYCQARELDATSLSVDVSAQKAADMPVRLDDIQIHIHLPTELDSRHRNGLKKTIEACLIHKDSENPSEKIEI
ncbi:MAG: hypothetical protein HC780_01240 [Leptolyngbyaceae cyanobacterium CSU_1_3]|nr:hypothetical protein [Leptolyngbyaceae cyanobacterium CSU_1_3]